MAPVLLITGKFESDRACLLRPEIVTRSAWSGLTVWYRVPAFTVRNDSAGHTSSTVIFGGVVPRSGIHGQK